MQPSRSWHKMANIYRDTRKNTLQISSSSRTKNGVPKFHAISGYFIEKSIIWMTIHKKFVQGCSGRVLINKPYFSVVLSSPTQTPLVNSWPLSCQQLSIELQRGIKKRPVTVGFHFLVFLPCVIRLRGQAATSSSKQFCTLITVVAEDTETRTEHDTVNKRSFSAQSVLAKHLWWGKLATHQARKLWLWCHRTIVLRPYM